MTQRRILHMVFSAALCAVVPAIAWAEDITVTTYYPSPRGVYDELRTTGQVEIGSLAAMTNPAEKLKIVGNSTATNLVIVSGWPNNNWVSLGANVPNRVDFTTGDVDLNINYNTGADVATSTFINGGTGNLGVGVDPATAPSAKLQVVATTGIDPFRVDHRADGLEPFAIHADGKIGSPLTIGNNPAGIELLVEGGIRVNQGVPVCFGFNPDQGGLTFNEAFGDTGVFSGGDGELALYANCDPSFFIYNHMPARVTLDPHYLFGVGFTSSELPTARLHVFRSGAAESFRVDDSIIGDPTPFVIDAGGNVGVGTASPAAKLDVNGEAIIGGVANDGTGHVVCIKADKTLGTCDSGGSPAPFDGTCRCN